jgi:hypothetical protein
MYIGYQPVLPILGNVEREFTMARWYRCGAWFGDHFQELSYKSEHRNNSRGNMEDARAAIRKHYGRRVAEIAEIRWTMLDLCMG